MKNLALIFLFPLACHAQDSTRKMTFSGYAEVYYAYDFGNPSNHTRPGFLYSFNRHNETTLNLGYLKAAYGSGNVRANLAFMAGTYSEYNLAPEGIFKNVFEASVGVRLISTRNLWVDAGILPSHIGFESAVGADCPNLTRSMLAENSPYYESGLRTSILTGNGKCYFAILILNGWQRIKRPDGNQTPAFGTQFTFRPGKQLMLNWSTFAGNAQRDSSIKWRYFSNFYCQWRASPLISAIIGFDNGMEQTGKHSSKYNTWYSPVAIVQINLSGTMKLSYRWEYFRDDMNSVIHSGGIFRTYGNSVNFDYWPSKNVVWRIEARALNSYEEIFYYRGVRDFNNYCVTTSLAIRMD